MKRLNEKRPTIDEAKAIDLVDYLAEVGYSPTRANGDDYWYLSPLRDEKTASFKVNRKKNVWYDHGLGKGGNFISFAMLYHNCTIPELLDGLAKSNTLTVRQPVPNTINIIPPPEEEHKRLRINRTSSLFTNSLISYLRDRRIPLHIADAYCREIHYSVGNRDFFGIGFENDMKSFEVRNPHAKISTPPKSIRTIDNGGNSVYVFEGFMDFLSFLTIYPEHPDFPRDYVILNSINQFEKARGFMEKHAFIHLFLDHDEMGRNYTLYALSISEKYQDESALYNGYKDLNDWLVLFGKGSSMKT